MSTTKVLIRARPSPNNTPAPTAVDDAGSEPCAADSARGAALASDVEGGRTCEEVRLALSCGPLPVEGCIIGISHIF